MLKKIIICISSCEFTLIEIGQDHLNVIARNKLQLRSLAELIKLSKAKVYILLLPDYKEQKFITKSLPFFSYLNIGALIKKVQAENQGMHYTVSDSFLLGKRGYFLQYAFAFTNLKAEINNFIRDIDGNFCGICFAFLESDQVAKKIFAHRKQINKNNFLFLYSSGNKLTVIKADEECIPFCIESIRLVHTTPTSVAGEIMQKIEDVSSSGKELFNIAIVVPRELGKIISQEKEYQNSILLTPYEAGILLGIEKLLKQDEYFADLLFAHGIILYQKVYKTLPNVYAHHVQQKIYNKYINYSLFITIFALFICILFFENNVRNKETKRNIILQELSVLSTEFGALQLELQSYDEKSKEKIRFYKFLQSAESFPVERIRKIDSKVAIDYAKLNSTDVVDGKGSEVDIEIVGRLKLKKAQLEEEIKQDYQDYEIEIAKDGNVDLHLKIKE